VFLIIDVIELKLVEKPELERRLGASYKEYRQRVPMLIPVPAGRFALVVQLRWAFPDGSAVVLGQCTWRLTRD